MHCHQLMWYILSILWRHAASPLVAAISLITETYFNKWGASCGFFFNVNRHENVESSCPLFYGQWISRFWCWSCKTQRALFDLYGDRTFLVIREKGPQIKKTNQTKCFCLILKGVFAGKCLQKEKVCCNKSSENCHSKLQVSLNTYTLHYILQARSM